MSSRIGILLFAVVGLQAEDLPRQAAEILAANCLTCHGAAMKMGELDLRSREAMLKGGKKGPVLTPGDPARSALYLHASHEAQPSMPPGKKLQDWQISVLRRWIGTGAPLEKPIDSGANDAKSAMSAMEERPITEAERQFWSFRPVKRTQAPQVRNRNWVRNPVDAFLLSAMESKGLKPSPAASKRTLVRRVYLDLWGLPPTPAQVDEFLNDQRPDAFELLVDKLLASSHYGERWARHWLDLVHYADSGGFEYDRDFKSAWRYRDWVVRAIAADKPYDQFVREQIAGDEIHPDDPGAQTATGFFRLGLEHNIKTEITRMDEMDDILQITGGTFLGMTIGCARCHNHKFDPIPQKDYYRMQAVFYSTKENDYPLADAAAIAAFKAANAKVDDLIKPLKKQVDDIEKPYRDTLIARERDRLPDYMKEALRIPAEKRTEGQKLIVIQVEKTRNFSQDDVLAAMSKEDRARREEVLAQIRQMEKQRPEPLPAAMAITESGPKAEPSYFLHRGSVDTKGSLMKPGVLSVATSREPEFPEPPAGARSTHRRKAFAEWLSSPDNPLFARVMVNRIWQHHFGEGIVRTPSNFGKTGDRPTHPELLDWLASEFVARGWSMKAMHRLMVTSSAYRQGSDDIAANNAIDADNKYVWRMPRQRIEGEIIRDQILAVAGAIDLKHYGPGVRPYIDPSLWQGSSGRTWGGTTDEDRSTWRRSIYVHSKRTIPLPMLEVFDRPDAITHCSRRNRSTIAPQALILMNNSFIRMQAGEFAKRLEREAGKALDKQIDLAFSLAFSRGPSQTERTAAHQFLEGRPEALSDFCQALFNSNEFLYTQ
ncbi:MAG: PSD1 and planctomycete cytochrome C domain-containing protein [Bryobacteraceae bacterium]|nr:PSD1 and planctomycete cytochrome C domain-containing protein [Bryobacteraceae bacterium]